MKRMLIVAGCMYGGIHFITAIEKGKEQGRKVGNFILSKLE